MRKIVVADTPNDEVAAYELMEELMLHVFTNCRNVEKVAFSRYGTPLSKWGTAEAFFREYAGTLCTLDWDSFDTEQSFAGLPEKMNLSR